VLYAGDATLGDQAILKRLIILTLLVSGWALAQSPLLAPDIRSNRLKSYTPIEPITLEDSTRQYFYFELMGAAEPWVPTVNGVRMYYDTTLHHLMLKMPWGTLRYVDSIGPGGGTGEVNTASNTAGTGVGWFKVKSGVDLIFKRGKSLDANLTIADSTDSLAFDFSNSPAFTGASFSGLTALRAVVTDGSKNLASSIISAVELGYLVGATDTVQEQLNLKAPLASPTFTGTVTMPLGAGTVRSGSGGLLSSTASDTVGLAAALSGKEDTITAGTTAQYYRGDKSWQTLNQAAVAGLTTASTPTFVQVYSSGQGGTGNAAAYLDGSGGLFRDPAVSGTELGYLDGVTSAIQTQLNGKAATFDSLGTDRGGTGRAYFLAGDMLYHTGTGTAFSRLAVAAQGNVLRSGATPSWGKVQLSGGVIDVSGTLGSAYGGTDNSSYTIGDMLYSSGATTLSKLADVATGSYLASGGVGIAPAWATLNQAAVAGLTTGDSPTFTGATLSGMTAGSVPFAGAAGLLSQDNANFFWDNANNRLGIGISSPVAVLHVATTNSNTFILDKGGAMGSLQGSFTSYSYGGLILGVSTASQFLALSIAGQRTTTPGAQIGRIGFHSWNTNNNLNTTIGAEFKATSEDGTTTNYGLNLAVLTRTGTGAMAERQRWSADGNIGFAGQTSFGTSAVGVGAWKNGTAPSTSPADAVQIWSADRGATVGKAGLHIRSEDGTSHVFSDFSGIGTVSPTTRLHVYGADNLTAQTVEIAATQANVTAADIFMDFRSSSGSEGTIAGTAVAGVLAYNTFTGAHYSQKANENEVMVEGMIVSASGNVMPGGDYLPTITRSAGRGDSTVYGVYAGKIADGFSQREIDSLRRMRRLHDSVKTVYEAIGAPLEALIKEQLHADSGSFAFDSLGAIIRAIEVSLAQIVVPPSPTFRGKTLDYAKGNPRKDLHQVFALGTGIILVTDAGGNINNGDLIVPSPTRGIGERQADKVVRSYTVAKATVSVDFSTIPVHPTLGVKVKRIPCTYKF